MSVGVIGLGNMGGALAANLVASGHDLVTHDLIGPERSPEGATFVDAVPAVAEAVDVVVLSLPDGEASGLVARQLVAAPGSRVTHIVDTSTIGVEAATAIDAFLAERGVAYVDAPVSGGVAGARARTLAVMYAAADPPCAYVEPVLAGLSDVRRRVGDRPGLAQALKLLNNFLSATALVATSEAVAFATAVGLDPATVLDVVNMSSGRSSASADKFPNHVLTGSYASGFSNSLMAKDLRLYVDSVSAHRAPRSIARVTSDIWERFAGAEPGVDFTRIHPFVEGAPDRA